MALAPVWGEGVAPPVRDALSVEPERVVDHGPSQPPAEQPSPATAGPPTRGHQVHLRPERRRCARLPPMRRRSSTVVRASARCAATMRASGRSAAAVLASSGSAASTLASSRSAAALPASYGSAAIGVLGCPPRRTLSRCTHGQQLEVCVGAVVSTHGATGIAAQSIGLCCRRYFRLHLRSGCSQLRCCQPRRPCRCSSGLCCCPLALLCCSEFGLLLAPAVRGDRVPRVSCGHGALLGGCCCSSVERILH
jgi:hypothetical protein